MKINVNGITPLIHFGFEYENPLAFKTYFTQEMLKEGFLAGNGVYASMAHTDEIIEQYLEACRRTFEKIEAIVNSDKNIMDELWTCMPCGIRKVELISKIIEEI